MRTYITLLLVGMLCVCLETHAQEYSWNITWTVVEKDLANKNQLGALGLRLHQLLKDAQKGNDPIATARALYTINRLHDKLYEDTLFFFNSRYQDSIILLPRADTLLKVVMLHLKARRILEFRDRYSGTARAALFRSYMPGEEYANLSRSALDSLSDSYYARAIELCAQVGRPDIRRLAWITTDPYGLLYQPTLVDFIYLDRTVRKITKEESIIANKLPENWTALSVDDCIRLKLVDSSFGKIYQGWMASRKNDPAAVSFIDLQFHRVLFNSVGLQDQKLYEQYLQTQAESRYAPTRASAVYQLCMMWTAARATERYETSSRTKRTTYRKAIELYSSRKSLLDSFAVLDVSLTNMVSELTATYYALRAKEKQGPHQPAIAELEFRNISTLYMRVIRLGRSESMHYGSNSIPLTLLQRKAVKDTIIHLPNYDDYNIHAAYVKLSPLPPGRYTWLFSDRPIDTVSKEKVRAVTIDLTNITAVPLLNRMYVLQSDSGFPMESAKVEATYKRDKKQWTESFSVNKQGWAPVRSEDLFFAEIIHQDDTTFVTSIQDFEGSYENVYVKDEYDTKAEYYEDNLYMKIFTDRGIYRPGQQVFFKGIVFTRDPDTGDEVILNWGSLKLPFYQKWLSRAIQKFGNNKIEMVVTDPFNKPVDTIMVWPNKYGSFTGSFNIPQSAPTGEWSFDNDWFDIDYRGQSFRVEEYKKPTMFLEIDQPTGLIKPGDSILIGVKVKSFAGADLDGVNVDLSISSSGFHHKINIDTTIISRKGRVQIYVTDSLARSLRDSTQRMSVGYTIDASATSTEGETVKKSDRIWVSNRPLEILNKLPGIIDAAAKPILRFDVNKKQGIKQGAYFKVRIHESRESTKNTHPDTWLYAIQELEPLLGRIDTQQVAVEPAKTWELNLGMSEKDSLLLSGLPAGSYMMEVDFVEGEEVIGEMTKLFQVFNSADKSTPPNDKFAYQSAKFLTPGKKAEMWYGNLNESQYVIYAASRLRKTKQTVITDFIYTERTEGRGLQQVFYDVPAQGHGNAKLHRILVRNGVVDITEHDLYDVSLVSSPEIIVEQYRKKLAPGAKEYFSVRIRTKNYSRAAELLTTMYDASLDELEKQDWEYQPERNFWHPPQIHRTTLGSLYGEFSMHGQIRSDITRPVWWSPFIDPIFENSYTEVQSALMGKMSGISVQSVSGASLNEVVVVGYASARKKSLTGSASVVSIRGMSTITAANAPLIIIDGVPFTGDVSTLDPSQLVDIVVLKGADATSLYGARAANGVVLVSTSGKVQLPAQAAGSLVEAPPVIRKNFQETAFFLPQVHADRKGYYNIEFTMPENVTSWRWMMLAHTMKGEFGYIEKTITTQLPVMVQPSLPRFVYQGDKIILKSRITNLDTMKLDGTLRIHIEDAVTGQDLTAKFTQTSATAISVAEGSNTMGAFQLKVPDSQLNPLKIRISYGTPSFSDGEEHTIPVLSNQYFFTATQRLPVQQGTQQLQLPAMDRRMQAVGIGYYLEPLPRASMMYALPGLVNYTWNCAEQTFSKIYGYAVAMQLIREDSSLARSWSKTALRQDEGIALPQELDENMIPWATLNKKSIQQQRDLYQLFDTVRSMQKVTALLNDLDEMQLSSGALPWFKGGDADTYITAHVVKSIGKMRQQGIRLVPAAQEKKLEMILGKMIGYLDGVLKDSLRRYSWWYVIDARGYHLGQYPVDAMVRKRADSILTTYKYNRNSSLAYEAEWVIMMRQWYPGNTPFSSAIDHKLESIRQEAVSDAQNGLRWKALADDEDLSYNNEETLALLAEAFTGSSMQDEVHRGVIQWLMQHRKDHGWGSTKATAQVVGLVARYAKEQAAPASVEVEGLSISNDLFAGKLTGYRETKDFPAHLKVNSSAATTLGVNYYYVSDLPPEAQREDLKITRRLSAFDEATQEWKGIDSNTVLRVGERVKVELEIFSGKLLQYVTIQDRRAATFEVPGMNSGYEWFNGLRYYQSVRDASMQFFASKIPAGRSKIQYEMLVSKEGEFSHGHAQLSCMYSPEKIAYSSAMRIVVK